MAEIIPAILPKDFDDLKDKLSKVSGLVNFVQVDVTDGKFAGEKSWPYFGDSYDESFLKIIRGDEKFPFSENLDLEVDLMVDKPEEEVNFWIKAGAKRVVIHFESVKNLEKLLLDIEEKYGAINETLRGLEIGLAINVDTPLSAIDKFISKINFIQCMGILKIGYQGATFDERVIDKVDHLRQRYANVVISVDGGVSAENASELLHVGANRLVVGSAIFGNENISKAVKDFKKIN